MPVGGGLGDSPDELLLEAGHPHHEELVEVRGDDGEELEPLESGTRGVARLVEDALVEPSQESSRLMNSFAFAGSLTTGVLIGCLRARAPRCVFDVHGLRGRASRMSPGGAKPEG